MPTTVTARVIGAERVVMRLRVKSPAGVRDNVRREVYSLGLTLERRVKLEKLMGQVLNRRAGRGVRSINTRFSEPSPDTFVSSTGTNLWYLRLWELTGHKAYTVVPRKGSGDTWEDALRAAGKIKKALYWKGARHPVRSVHIPAEGPRPFLRPTLREMRPEIRRRLHAAASAT